jgi:hypothetical protein
MGLANLGACLRIRRVGKTTAIARARLDQHGVPVGYEFPNPSGRSGNAAFTVFYFGGNSNDHGRGRLPVLSCPNRTAGG